MSEYVSKLNIVPLDASFRELASSFHCGNDVIDRFLRSSDSLDPTVGKTYLWVNENRKIIYGFYNITTGYIEQEMDGNMSDVLLLECLMRIENIQNNHVGFSFVTLCSSNEGYKLYERNGFEELEDDMTVSPTYGKEFQAIPMYLPLGVEE